MLNHENVVKVVDVIEIDELVYIVMEQISGGDLFDYLVKHSQMREEEALRLFRQIIDAVDHCHTSKVVHRDLKAENILLDENKNVKIADFGFAAEMKPGEKLTKSCGSPNYAAPELLYKGCSYDGPEIDVWSCGVILYALLTIRLPFDAPQIPDLFRLIKRGKYSVPGSVPAGAKDLIERMLVVDPEKRITIAEIRQHGWFLKGEAPTSSDTPVVAESALPATTRPIENKSPCILERCTEVAPVKDQSDKCEVKLMRASSKVSCRKIYGPSHATKSCGNFGRMSAANRIMSAAAC